MNPKLLTISVAAMLIYGASAETLRQMGADEQAALQKISAQSMRGHLAFLASDALEGRGTPSRGLDVAAEYIAAQFRRAGLEPVEPKGSYFQTADFVSINSKLDDASVTLRLGDEQIKLGNADLRVNSGTAIDLPATEIVRVPNDNMAGKVVMANLQAWGRPDQLAKLQVQKPALILLVTNRAKPRVLEAPIAKQTAGYRCDPCQCAGRNACIPT